VNSLKHK